jgi:hypothetical protein
MARAVMDTKIDLPEYKNLLRDLQKITKDTKLISQKMRSALRYAAKPTFEALTANVSKLGTKTGNLARAVNIKAKAYSKSGNAVVLVGYISAGKGTKKQRKAGRTNAYHQHLVEFGTRPRYTKRGSVASSYSDFKFAISKRNGMIHTQGYPSTFFKRARAGHGVQLGRMPVGGSFGRPPLRDAFERTKSQIRTRLADKTPKVIKSIYKALDKKKAQ